MEGGCLRKALGTVHTPVTVGHMMTVRGHMRNFDTLTTFEQAQLVKTYDSLNLEKRKDGPIAARLVQWFTTKKEVSSKSRTAALWLKYAHYIEPVQLFIKTE